MIRVIIIKNKVYMNRCPGFTANEMSCCSDMLRMAAANTSLCVKTLRSIKIRDTDFINRAPSYPALDLSRHYIDIANTAVDAVLAIGESSRSFRIRNGKFVGLSADIPHQLKQELSAMDKRVSLVNTMMDDVDRYVSLQHVVINVESQGEKVNKHTKEKLKKLRRLIKDVLIREAATIQRDDSNERS